MLDAMILGYPVVAITTRLRFDGRSTAYRRVTKVTMTLAEVTMTYLLGLH